ncbi:hypothetical protein WA556_006258 [Blastocystis sp. ATCC 50177/Nand II]
MTPDVVLTYEHIEVNDTEPLPLLTQFPQVKHISRGGGGNHRWQKFFNKYKLTQERNYKTAHTVVYIKRGTTGLSGELIGICDALFIGFYTGRAIRFYSTVITRDLFDFGLLHMPLNSTLISKKKVLQHAPPSFKSPYAVTITGQEPKDYASRISTLKSVGGTIQLNTLHVLADRFIRNGRANCLLADLGLLFSRFERGVRGHELYGTVDRYYGRCVKSLFRPSAQVQAWLEKFEAALGDGVRIGVHIRMGQGKSDWTDSRPFLEQKHVDAFIKRLKKFVAQQRRSHKGGVKIFLSTDSSEEEALMRRSFPGMVVTTEGFRRSHVGGVRAAKVTQEAVMKAVLDQMLLGKCDYLFLTRMSGFSKMGLYFAEENTSFKYIWLRLLQSL